MKAKHSLPQRKLTRLDEFLHDERLCLVQPQEAPWCVGLFIVGQCSLIGAGQPVRRKLLGDRKALRQDCEVTMPEVDFAITGSVKRTCVGTGFCIIFSGIKASLCWSLCVEHGSVPLFPCGPRR